MKVRSRIRWVTAIFFFISGIITGTWTSRIPEIQQKFGLDDAKWGGVLFAIPIGLVLGLPLSSWLVAKFTSYKMMVVSAIVYALLLCLLPFTNNVYILAALLFLFGMSRNLLNISVNTNAIVVQQIYRRPIISNFHGIWSLACLVAAGIGTLVIWNKIKPGYHFLLVAVVAIIVVFLARVKRNGKTVVAPGKRPFLVKPDGYLLLLGIMCFCSMVCEGTMFDWGINYFKKVVRADRNFITAGYASFITSMTLGRFFGDKLVAMFGAIQMLIINGILIAAGFTIAVAFPFLWTACFGFLLIGFGDSILVPVIYSLAGQSKKMLPGYAIASVTMIGYAGFLSAPLIVGSISKAFGMQYSFGLMIVFSSCISIVGVLVKRNANN